MFVCVYVCVRACVRACMRVCVHVCVTEKERCTNTLKDTQRQRHDRETKRETEVCTGHFPAVVLVDVYTLNFKIPSTNMTFSLSHGQVPRVAKLNSTSFTSSSVLLQQS